MNPGDPSSLIRYFPLGSRLTEFVGQPGSAFVLPATGIKTPDGTVNFVMEFESDEEKVTFLESGKLMLTFQGGVPPFSLGAFLIEHPEAQENSDTGLSTRNGEIGSN